MSDLPAIPLPREDEIITYLQSGWHPLKIARTMSKKGINISAEAIAQYAKDIEIVPLPSPLRVHSGSDRITDAHQDLHQLVLAEESRVVFLLKQEQQNGEPSPSTNTYLNMLWRHLRELAELEHTLGISPHEATGQASDQPRSVQTLREMLESKTDKTVTLERITVEPNG